MCMLQNYYWKDTLEKVCTFSLKSIQSDRSAGDGLKRKKMCVCGVRIGERRESQSSQIRFFFYAHSVHFASTQLKMIQWVKLLRMEWVFPSASQQKNDEMLQN